MERARAMRVPKNPKPTKPLLSPRMKECAELMRAGYPTRSIAMRMGLSPATVATYSKRIYAALKIKSRAELQALPMGDAELDKLRKELAAVRKDRDRIRGMYDGLDVARESIVVRAFELEAGLVTLQAGIREILAMPEDDDREKFDKIFEGGPGARFGSAEAREAFVEAMKGARMVGLSTSQKLAEQLALLTSPCAARELAEAKEDAARVNRLYDTAIAALCRTRADLVALQNECLELTDGSGACPGSAGSDLRLLVEGSQARARHDEAVSQAKPLGLLEQAAIKQEIADRQAKVRDARRVPGFQTWAKIALEGKHPPTRVVDGGVVVDYGFAIEYLTTGGACDHEVVQVIEREVQGLHAAWNLLDTTVSSVLTSRTATWNTDELRAALEQARALAEGKPST